MINKAYVFLTVAGTAAAAIFQYFHVILHGILHALGLPCP